MLVDDSTPRPRKGRFMALYGLFYGSAALPPPTSSVRQGTLAVSPRLGAGAALQRPAADTEPLPCYPWGLAWPIGVWHQGHSLEDLCHASRLHLRSLHNRFVPCCLLLQFEWSLCVEVLRDLPVADLGSLRQAGRQRLSEHLRRLHRRAHRLLRAMPHRELWMVRRAVYGSGELPFFFRLGPRRLFERDELFVLLGRRAL
jgi:hypothetical protein